MEDNEKKIIVGYTDGVYDMFHVGHLHMIKSAKERCDYLIVGVHSDEVVYSYKHHYPVIKDKDRCEIINSIRYVDEAHINLTRDKKALHDLYHFDVIFIGDDWKGTERWNKFEKELAKVGVRVEYIPYTKGVSSTQIKEYIKEHENI